MALVGIAFILLGLFTNNLFWTVGGIMLWVLYRD